jgi:predicted AAA+ superfamily ATPase
MFPGRTGHGREVLVLPLAFHEYLIATGRQLKDLMFDVDKLINLFQEYKTKGGFPKSINDNDDAEESLIRGIVSEIHRHEKSVRISQDIMYSILQKIPSSFSYNSVATDMGVSHNTVREYIEFFEDIFVLAIAYIKNQSNEILWRREKKVFFRDPFILRTISGWVGCSFNEDSVVEGIVQEHMLRKFGEVYFFRDHFEVDVVSGNYKIEPKSHRAHRGYPKDVTLLKEDDVPYFLIRLFQT